MKHFRSYLPELHPAQQGLKVIDANALITSVLILPELHPAQQGLKVTLNRRYELDGNTSRTTSSTTRIESYQGTCVPLLEKHFQNYIQHNKD